MLSWTRTILPSLISTSRNMIEQPSSLKILVPSCASFCIYTAGDGSPLVQSIILLSNFIPSIQGCSVAQSGVEEAFNGALLKRNGDLTRSRTQSPTLSPRYRQSLMH